MGSFNTSCAVSKCSINPGDRVKLIPIVSQTSTVQLQGFGCYVWDNFSFVGFAMDAKYDDYASYEIEDNDISKYNLEMIKSNYNQTEPPSEVSPYSSRSSEFTPVNELTWDVVCEMIHFGTIHMNKTNNFGNNPDRNFLSFFVVHESVYNVLLNCRHESWSDDGFKMVSFENEVQSSCKKFEEDQIVFNDLIKDFMDLYEDDIGTLDKMGNVYTVEQIYQTAKNKAKISMSLNYDRMEYSYKKTSLADKFIDFCTSTLNKTLNDDEIKNIIRKQCELSFVVSSLQQLNSPILPAMSAGQEYNKTNHALFLISMGTEMLKLQEEHNDTNMSYSIISNNYILVSLKRLKEEAEDDYKPERGKRIIELINKYVSENDKESFVTKEMLENDGYGEMLDLFDSALLEFKIVNDLENK